VAKSRRRFSDAIAVARELRPSYPVYCLRPQILAETARRFITLFPGTVLYAVKCNPHPLVLDELYKAGIRHFDTASLPEIAQVCEAYHDAQAYFMHPVKGRAVIESAYKVYGIRHYVVDHMRELDKVLEETGGQDVVIVVRLKTPPARETLYDLSSKFGASPEEAADLLRAAAGHGCQVGLSFHVGSQCGDPEAYRTALLICGETLRMAKSEIVCLDVGGGFPGYYLNSDAPPITEYISVIRDGLKSIGVKPTVEVFAEPGRALVADAISLLVQVQLRKDNRLYINDGIYGSLNELALSDLRLPARLIRLDRPVANDTADFVLNGPTCDSLDVLRHPFILPADAAEGDWIEIGKVGAYSYATATRFNGFYPETFVEVHDAPPAGAR